MSDLITAPNAPAVHIAKERPILRLDLGGGDNVREGFECVDFFAPNAKHKVNLFEFPWPWETSSVDELHASHFLEHVPMCYWNQDKTYSQVPKSSESRDLLCRFMDEAYRVLIPGGKFTVIVPSARSDRAFQDPTHRRFWNQNTFFYWDKRWRDANKLGHYLCECDFETAYNATIPMELTLLHLEAQARRTNEGWNTTYDFVGNMISRKPKGA